MNRNSYLLTFTLLARSMDMVVVQMIEGTPAFHPKPQEEAAKMICLEGLRPPFKNKPKYYPSDVKE